MRLVWSAQLSVALVGFGLILVGCSEGGADAPPRRADLQGIKWHVPALGQSPAHSPRSSGAHESVNRDDRGGPSLLNLRDKIAAAGRLYAKLQKKRNELRDDSASSRQKTERMRRYRKAVVAANSSLTIREYRYLVWRLRFDHELRRPFFEAVVNAGGQIPG